jgi:hypothetical protein
MTSAKANWPAPSEINGENMSETHHETEHDQDKELHLTIRATNGAIWDIDEFKPQTKIKGVIKKAVAHFIDLGAMTDGDYRLALLVNDVAQPPLNENDTLAESHVQDDTVLTLLVRGPQVDG